MTIGQREAPGRLAAWPLRWFRDLRVRSKVLVPVVAAAAVILAVIVVGALAVSSTAGAAQRLYAHAALPLDALGHVRDSEGDSRVAVREFVLATTPKQRDTARQDILAADAALDAAVADYRAGKGTSMSPARAKELTAFTTGVTAWRHIRDTQVLPAATTGGATAAQTVIAGPLATADARFAAAMDRIDTEEGADARALAAAARRQAATARWELVLLGAVGLLLAVAIGALVARALTRPLSRVAAALAALADGDLTTTVQVSSHDEVGQMAAAFVRAQAATRDTVTSLGRSANTLQTAAAELTGVGRELAEGADAANSLATDAATSAAEVSADVAGVADGAEQMGASIGEIARNSADAARVASDATTAAHDTGAMVDRLAEAANSIADVTRTISAVADQTKLLALNATIEAARAGEAGKGFAVVADEVKQLAQETAAATADIATRVTAINTETAAAIAAIAAIAATVGQINDYQGTVAAAVEQQSATTREMTRGIAAAAGRTHDIAATITRVAALTATTRSGVTGAENAATTLSELSAELLTQIGRFTT